jgi:hypothetical protein
MGLTATYVDFGTAIYLMEVVYYLWDLVITVERI